MNTEDKKICELCERHVPSLTEHHLIPKELGGRNLDTAMLCVPCHKQIHALFTNKELAIKLNSIANLKNNEKIIRYLKFIKKHPGDSYIQIKKSKAVRKKGY
ncbi:MAG: HNH endonuclease [Clostridium perfringens]|nr:HNH endonuclease [Clostridium perfringens]